MSDDVIKEFLVSLGFQINTASENRFKDSMRSATLQAKLLGDAIEGALKKLMSMTVQVAENFDQMFYASARIGASVENIKTFNAAVSQLGSSAAAGSASLESLGKFLRVNPGGAHFIESLGVSLRKANGELKQTDELLVDLAAKMKGKQYGLQMKVAEMLGVDENTWRAAQSGEMSSKQAQARDIYAKVGIDLKKASENGRLFTNQMRTLGVTLEAEKMIANLLGEGGSSGLEGVNRWLAANGGKIADTLSHIASKVLELLHDLLEWLKDLTPAQIDEWFSSFNKALDSFTTGIRTAAHWVGDLVKQITDLMAIVDKFAKNTGITKWLGRIMGYHDDELDIPKDEQTHNEKSWNQDSWFQKMLKGGKSLLGGVFGGRNKADDANPTPSGAQREGAGGRYSAAQVAQIVKRNGGTDAEAAMLGAISQPESRGNPRAFNPVGRDLSYGLFQINMLGAMGPERRKKYGLKSNEDLYDPDVAARVAIRMHRESKGYHDWSTYSAGKHTPYLGAAIRGAREYTPEKPSEVPQGLIPNIKTKPGFTPWGNVDPDAIKRKMSAPPAIAPQAWNQSNDIEQNNHVTIYGAGDAHAVGSEINLAHARATRHLASMIRNTNGAAA